MICISLNVIAVVLQTPNPSANHSKSATELAAEWVDFLTTIIFTVEVGLRLYALHWHFFDNHFNNLDLFIILTSWPSYLFSDFDVKMSALRGLRCLRPLRTVEYLAGLRAVIGALSLNIGFLVHLMYFLGLTFILFGCIAIEFYNSALKKRCVLRQEWVPNATTGIIVSGLVPAVPTAYCTGNTTGTGYYCAESLGHFCQSNYGNPQHGYGSFDNFYAAAVVLFQITTASDWHSYAIALYQSVNTVSYYYPIFVILFVSFMVVNLFVAVITFGFGQVNAMQ